MSDNSEPACICGDYRCGGRHTYYDIVYKKQLEEQHKAGVATGASLPDRSGNADDGRLSDCWVCEEDKVLAACEDCIADTWKRATEKAHQEFSGKIAKLEIDKSAFQDKLYTVTQKLENLKREYEILRSEKIDAEDDLFYLKEEIEFGGK